jgi:hypothetical protein
MSNNLEIIIALEKMEKRYNERIKELTFKIIELKSEILELKNIIEGE